MTGREFIIYILAHGLENESIFKEDGSIIGFITDREAAAKFGVGTMTIAMWVNNGLLDGVRINDSLMIPEIAKDPREVINNVKEKENNIQNPVDLDLSAFGWKN